MIKKTLLDTNPYLANPKLMAKMIHEGVISSTAIEGVHIKNLITKTNRKKIISNTR